MALATQTKILRVLQQGEIQRRRRQREPSGGRRSSPDQQNIENVRSKPSQTFMYRILTLLEHAEDLGLRRQRHVADFIQENCAAIALLEFSDALDRSPGKSPFRGRRARSR